MAVDAGYVERLRQWIEESVARCVRGKGDGVNAFARETKTRLERHGLAGLAPSQISRWRQGDLKEPIADSSLTKIGILRGLSVDHEEAKRLAREWLEGAIEVPAEVKAPAWYGVESIPYESLGPEELVDLLVRSGMRLGELAASVAQSESSEPEPVSKPEPTHVTKLLIGTMQTANLDLEGLADLLGVTPDRMADILQGHIMDPAECEAAAEFTEMPVEVLVQWGGCMAPALAPQPTGPAS